MNSDTEKSTHVGESGGAKLPTKDMGNSSNGTPLNKSMTSSDGEWFIQVPDEIVQGIRAQFGADREVGLSKATGFLKMGYMMAQSFGSIVTTDQLQQVIDDGAERLGEHGESWIEEMQELSAILKQEMVEGQSEGNSKLAESLEGTVTLLDSAIKEIGNPKNTDSLPFVVANLVEQKVAAALASATKAQAEANDEQKTILDGKIRILEAQHAKLVQVIQSERESCREAFGLQSMLDEVERHQQAEAQPSRCYREDSAECCLRVGGDAVRTYGHLHSTNTVIPRRILGVI